jgi:hypothetical protein
MVSSPITPSNAGDPISAGAPDRAAASVSPPSHDCPQHDSAADRDAVACAECILRAQTPDFTEMLCRIRAEFLEMPGLCLTEPQARRLWSLDGRTCSTLLAALVDAKLLVRTADGQVMSPDCPLGDERSGR